ncbi:MAG: LamG domain-containing protein [Kiritimatiellae bacterium]|nr:LamG domain-containing protein [Kiritimatiellia bacterium]
MLVMRVNTRFPLLRTRRCLLLGAAALVCAAGRASELDGLVGYWPFDEGQGTLAANVTCMDGDWMGCTGHADLREAGWAPGRFGPGLAAARADVRPLNGLACRRAVTVAAWIKPGHPKGRWILVNREYAYRLCVNQAGKNRVRLQLNLDGNWANNWLAGNTSLPNGEWVHVAGVYDGRERRIYVNGQLDGRGPASGAIGAGARNFRFSAGGSGVLDEVKIWQRALSGPEISAIMRQDKAQVLARLRPEHRLWFYPVKVVAWAGVSEEVALVAFNAGKQEYAGELRCVLRAAGGETTVLRRDRVRIAPRGTFEWRPTVNLARPGRHALAVCGGERTLFETALYAMHRAPRRAPGPLKTTPVLDVDLARELGPAEFCDDGTSRVVDSALGRYREAGPADFSRFVVRTPVRKTGLHLLRVTYPDDKPRQCEIIAWSPARADLFSAQTGYFTGVQYPLSMQVQTVDCMLWVRDVNQAVVFTSRQRGQPAAAARVELFEIEGGLPAAPAARGPNQRRIGLYWEDAQPLHMCHGGTATDLAGFDAMAVNLCDYMDYCGLNVLYHPLVWYDGPIYNSCVEPRGARGGQDFPPDGFVDILLNRFEERGFRFFAVLNVHRLPSLAADRTEFDAVAAGAATARTVTRENRFGPSWHGRPPAYNALHPAVQKPVKALVGEMAHRYARSPAFGGVTLHLTRCQLLWPGDLDASYDDWTIAQFEKDTGLRVDADARDPNRFGKRYDWLMANARQPWIDWRCRRTAEFYGELADAVRAPRGDLQLVLSLWDPFPARIAERWRKGERLVELVKEYAIDLDLLKGRAGLAVQRYMSATDYRHKARGGKDSALGLAHRQIEFDDAQMKELRRSAGFGVYLHNRYWESSLRNKKRLPCEWFPGINWRASALVPAHEHFMEYYAHAMALFDPADISVGGFTTGTVGHEGRVEKFARVFRALPQGAWETVAGVGEHVVCRMLETNGKRYAYLVNRSPQPVTIALPAPGVPPQPCPLGASPPLAQAAGRWTVTLAPYELAAWAQGE